MRIIAVIPARLESTRLPGKLLLTETGKPVISHTIEAAQKHFETIVTTDSIEIYHTVKQNHKIPCYITGNYRSGTERVQNTIYRLEEQLQLKPDDIIINWQADEPEIDGQFIENFLPFEEDIMTIAAPIALEEYNSPNVVKVVLDHRNIAMYFSRSPIPYNDPSKALRHIGIYVFKNQILRLLNALDSPRYSCEGLEQMQWLEAGVSIKVNTCYTTANGINTIEDYQKFVARTSRI